MIVSFEVTCGITHGLEGPRARILYATCLSPLQPLGFAQPFYPWLQTAVDSCSLLVLSPGCGSLHLLRILLEKYRPATRTPYETILVGHGNLQGRCNALRRWPRHTSLIFSMLPVLP